MTRRHLIAVAVGLATIVLALAPPLWVRTTGDEVALALRPVDPLSLFRGNYVDLAYDVDTDGLVDGGPGSSTSTPTGETVFVVFDDARPANAVRVETDRPDLGEGETCIRGRWRGRDVDFPQLEQYFVTAEQGGELETRLDELVGVIRTTGACRAILVDLEPR